MTVIGEQTKNKGYVAAIGFFDGVHVGHRALIGETLRIADRTGCTPAVFTFDAASSYKGMPLLITEAEKEKLLFSYGIRTLFRVDFQEISSLSSHAFVDDILRGSLGVRHTVVGSDFRYGSRASGNAEMLAASIPTAIIPPVALDGVTVSSTVIRRAISGGDMERATAMLSRPFGFSGKVLHGKALGKSLGFPTLNLSLPQGMLLPRRGVYASQVTVGGETYGAVTNVGVRPSVETTEIPNVESHLLDADGDFYGQSARVELLYYVREEQKFSSLGALQAAIGEDTESVRQWMNRYTHS